MSQKHHLRTVEIRTITATCDTCGASGCAGRETLLQWGWRLAAADACPDCAGDLLDRQMRAEENEARAKYIAALETDATPPLVRGRVFTETGAVLYTRDEINGEITRALDRNHRRHRRFA